MKEEDKKKTNKKKREEQLLPHSCLPPFSDLHYLLRFFHITPPPSLTHFFICLKPTQVVWKADCITAVYRNGVKDFRYSRAVGQDLFI
jgi:hypothetical protein